MRVVESHHVRTSSSIQEQPPNNDKKRTHQSVVEDVEHLLGDVVRRGLDVGPAPLAAQDNGVHEIRRMALSLCEDADETHVLPHSRLRQFKDRLTACQPINQSPNQNHPINQPSHKAAPPRSRGGSAGGKRQQGHLASNLRENQVLCGAVIVV